MGIELFENATSMISSKFFINTFPLKCIPGLALVGVLPLGQVGHPPDVQVSLEILQTATYNISSKFC